MSRIVDILDTYKLADKEVNRMGYGAMQLAGHHAFGPPKDRFQAINVLRTALDLGINHIDTSDFYGPHITNQIIKEALSAIANDLGASPKQVALAWLLKRSSNILLIPGTSSIAHLKENIAASQLVLSDEIFDSLNALVDA